MGQPVYREYDREALDREYDNYHRQTDEQAAAWRRGGLAVEVMDMAGHDHFSIAAELADPKADLTSAILRHMGLR